MSFIIFKSLYVFSIYRLIIFSKMGQARKAYETLKDDYDKYHAFHKKNVEYKDWRENELKELTNKVTNFKLAKEEALMKVESIKLDVRSKGVMGGASDGAQLEARATSLVQSLNSIKDQVSKKKGAHASL